MARQRKAAKLAGKKDLLTELPDGILFTIISKLTLKEAVRTSVLSKQWRSIWTWHADLLFDCASVLGGVVCSDSRSNFVERVNQIMHHRYFIGTKIDSLAIHFHLEKDYAIHLDEWIRYAITKGVESIDFDLSDPCCFTVDHATSYNASGKYEFPCSFLAASGKECRVKHLSLASCGLSAFPASSSLSSLITIQLQCVTFSDQYLESLLSSCLFLEKLSLQQCFDLVSPAIAGPNLRLKILIIEDCFRLQKMELCTGSLVLFEYTGHLISFHFKNVPNLASAFLNFIGESRVDAGSYALTRFVRDLPQLESLNLVSLLTMKMVKLPENVSAFTNVKQLVLTVFPFDDEDKLLWISYVLKAFPSLIKLQLNLFCPSYIKQSTEIERVLPGCPHRQLSEVEINGFHCNQHEVVLLKYLLDNLVELKVLAISPCQKVYRGFNKWVYEAALFPSSCYELRMKSVYEWLHKVVPRSVHLQIRQVF